jgi:hypothetical protein
MTPPGAEPFPVIDDLVIENRLLKFVCLKSWYLDIQCVQAFPRIALIIADQIPNHHAALTTNQPSRNDAQECPVSENQLHGKHRPLQPHTPSGVCTHGSRVIHVLSTLI